ncbi:hypothetical protein AB6A40_001823 [Gnathostoma spinigerum]|uniref:E3 ubiquitin-protein ligase RNF170 n=1 Tax=Gnathostoma spinigerum TaxID=75299 RepID=A0ABD6EAF5_9BILA
MTNPPEEVDAMESRLIGGLSNEVTIALFVIVVLLLITVHYCSTEMPAVNTVHPSLEAIMEEFRSTFMGTSREPQPVPLTRADNPPHRYGDDRTCPICFSPASFAILTNCGHLFCCNCIYSYWRHTTSLTTPVSCAVCRTVVSILMPMPVEGERENNTIGAAECDSQLNDYNRRFSGESRPILDYIRDLPVLVPYMLRTMVSINGIIWMFRIRVLLCLLAVVVYILSPFDILPEAVFGILGMADDLFITFVVLIYATILFRQFMADGHLPFAWNGVPSDRD